MVAEKELQTGEVTLHYVEGPSSGPPLVLLHGGSGRWHHFSTLLPDLVDRWHLFLPELRGHGQSGQTPGRYRLRDYTRDICVSLHAVVPTPAYLFGHSLGGMVALLVSAQCPARVRAVGVGDAPLSGETWAAILRRDRENLALWRSLAGGQQPMEAVIEALKDSFIQVTGDPTPRKMREVAGEDAPFFRDWLPTSITTTLPCWTHC